MAQIHVLSKETIDKIAAGEVVERPLSVVKELLENAIDAGASAITVEIKEGGISFIRVTDNGCGIDKTEVSKAFLRHATSKIQTADDLYHIGSLGFRGEALSSIAAVSGLELITKTKNDLTGLHYVVEGGEEKEREEIGAPDGTTMIVRNLFFNTPVRKKFLKQPQTEGGYVSDLMEHMAMSHPDISFKYTNNGQTRFHTSGNGSLREIIYRIFGKDISDSLIPVETCEEGIQISGFLGKPEINRANRNFEIYFVNGRYIKSDLIRKAIEEGYKKFVMQHKFPFAVLHFTINAHDIDVNVHPSKMEVRFTNQSRLYDFISTTIVRFLHSTELIPQVTPDSRKPKENTKPLAPAPEPFETQRIQNAKNAVMEQPLYQTDRASVPLQSKLQENMHSPIGVSVENKIYGTKNRKELQEYAGNHSNVIKVSEQIIVEKPMQLNMFEEKLLTKEARTEYHILGQIFDTYWLVAFHDKLFIIDQHAAHEKVKYEKIIQAKKEHAVLSQRLDPPVIVSLTGKEEEVLKEYAVIFADMGFETEEFGGNEYALRSVPADLYGLSEKGLFLELLDELAEGTAKGTPDAVEMKIAGMACKAAVKGNTSLSLSEMEVLLDELLLLEDPYHCPHGRPTIISMSKYEIEKKFKRIV